MDKVIKHHKKVNNEGSALVTVIVAACLLSIIATTLLFVAVKNYKTRQIEYQSKQNFYEAEKILDELKSIMIEDCSKACSKAYVDVMNQYMELGVEGRQSTYNDLFAEYFYEVWKKKNVGMDLTKTVQSLFDDEKAEAVEKVENFEFNHSEGYVVLSGITISVSTIDGYYSRVTTDIRVDAPKIDWANGAGNNKVHTLEMKDFVSYVNWRRD